MRPDDRWRRRCYRCGKLLGPDRIQGNQGPEGPKHKARGLRCRHFHSPLRPQAVHPGKHISVEQNVGRMVDHKRLHDLGEPGPVLVHIKRRDCGRNIFPGGLRLQGRFDRLAQERIREGLPTLSLALRLRQDRTWSCSLDACLLLSRLGSLSVEDTGRGRCWGQESSARCGRRGEDDEQAEPDVEAPSSRWPALILLLAARLHGARASLACGWR